MAQRFHGVPLSFVAEWYHEESNSMRNFIMNFFPGDDGVEIIDLVRKRPFMRHTVMSGLFQCDFFIGSKVNIFGRIFNLVDYADAITRAVVEKYRKKTFLLVKCSLWQHLGTVLNALIESKFSINNALMAQFSSEQVNDFLRSKTKEATTLLNELIVEPGIGVEVMGEDVVETVNACYTQSEHNPENVASALVALFAREDIKSGIYCSRDEEEANQDLKFFFGQKKDVQLSFGKENTTLAIIKPHCIKEGNLGKIISEITGNGFKITALRMKVMERNDCENFLEVYKGVLPEFINFMEKFQSPMVQQMSSGAFMALGLRCQDEHKNTYAEFRTLCGPLNPEIAKLIKPQTLRAKFGMMKALNAIHCTDLKEDTDRELKYFFTKLD